MPGSYDEPMTQGHSTRSVADHAALVDRLIRTALGRRGPDTVAVEDAHGRVAHTDLRALIDVPSFRNSQMDGYAVDAAAVARVPVELDVTGVVAAGDDGGDAHVPGTARKIMTGAPVPRGADAIVPVEDTEAVGGRVRIGRSRRSGEYVREQGSDVRVGDVVVPAGTRLGARHVGAIVAVGHATVPVRPRLRVAVIATGAELVAPGTKPGPGCLYDSNGPTLAAAAIADGAEVTVRTRSTDSAEHFAAVLDDARTRADVVVTSGGVSMGDFEVVRDVLGPRGGTFGHVGMQPGGPQGWTDPDGTPVISFPGNPVSTLVSYMVFARPVLRDLAGLPALRAEDATLVDAVRSIPGKRQFLRGRRTPDGITTSGPGSHLVASMAAADVLVDVPEDTTDIPAGATVRVWPL